MSPKQASDILRWPQDYDPEVVMAARQAMASAGGRARAAKLSAEQQSISGRKAVQARWARYRAKKAEAEQGKVE